ncbi:MAG: peptide deformylase [Bacteroidales bacterium]|nr:peptide deformylase [Bacteroidales bacterium]MDD3890798.1 peptide deformylase [Bacteroidales bacterium]
MIKPVYVYGSSVLRRVAEDITPDYPNLNQLYEDMFETMYQSDGIGLAAPQIGLSIRVFVIDASPLADEHPDMKDFKKIFINAKITERIGNPILFNEGCLSIPNIREDVERPETVTIEYLDENFAPHIEKFEGLAARIIQHEYDHLDGILFTDRVSPIRRQLLKSKLNAIAKGKFSASYRVKLV